MDRRHLLCALCGVMSSGWCGFTRPASLDFTCFRFATLSPGSGVSSPLCTCDNRLLHDLLNRWLLLVYTRQCRCVRWVPYHVHSFLVLLIEYLTLFGILLLNFCIFFFWLLKMLDRFEFSQTGSKMNLKEFFLLFNSVLSGVKWSTGTSTLIKTEGLDKH